MTARAKMRSPSPSFLNISRISPVLLNDSAYVGVAVTSLPGRPGFHWVRTPRIDQH
jgi:hypothetical protein